jgi:hypothetical protein
MEKKMKKATVIILIISTINIIHTSNKCISTKKEIPDTVKTKNGICPKNYPYKGPLPEPKCYKTLTDCKKEYPSEGMCIDICEQKCIKTLNKCTETCTNEKSGQYKCNKKCNENFDKCTTKCDKN